MTPIILFFWYLMGLTVSLHCIQERQQVRVHHVPGLLLVSAVWPIWYVPAMIRRFKKVRS